MFKKYVVFPTKMKYFKKIMKENINKIKKCKLFNRIKEDELEALLSCLNAKLIKYDKNITILKKEKFYILLA